MGLPSFYHAAWRALFAAEGRFPGELIIKDVVGFLGKKTTFAMKRKHQPWKLFEELNWVLKTSCSSFTRILCLWWLSLCLTQRRGATGSSRGRKQESDCAWISSRAKMSALSVLLLRFFADLISKHAVLVVPTSIIAMKFW